MQSVLGLSLPYDRRDNPAGDPQGTPMRVGRFWLYPSGHICPVIAGASDTGPAPAPAGGGLSADDLKALDDYGKSIGAREKDQGKRSGRKEVLEALGLDPEDFDPDDVKALLEKARTDDEAAKGEAQAAKDKAERETTKAREQQKAAAELIAKGIKREALRDAGVSKDNLDLAMGLIVIDGDVTEEAATAAVKTLSENPALATLFSGAGDGGGAGGGDGGAGGDQGGPGAPGTGAGGTGGGAADSATGGGPPPGGGGQQKSALERGKERAAKVNDRSGTSVLDKLGGRTGAS